MNKRDYVVLGDRFFDTSVEFVVDGRKCFGAWGRLVIHYVPDDDSGYIDGFQANNPNYSWGFQMDGRYIERKIHHLDSCDEPGLVCKKTKIGESKNG